MSRIRTTPRTQDEILDRAGEAWQRDPLLHTEAIDLLAALDREHLAQCTLIDQDTLKKNPDLGTDPVTPTKAREEAIEYMEFAMSKAEGQRGISAWRSLCHYAAWLWLCLEDEDYARFADWEDYDDYGLAHLALARELLGMDES